MRVKAGGEGRSHSGCTEHRRAARCMNNNNRNLPSSLSPFHTHVSSAAPARRHYTAMDARHVAGAAFLAEPRQDLSVQKGCVAGNMQIDRRKLLRWDGQNWSELTAKYRGNETLFLSFSSARK